MKRAQYSDHPKAKPGDPCEVCGAESETPTIDHCHEHGWVRGTLCHRCNASMASIDRRARPVGDPVFIETLLQHVRKCHECSEINSDDLGPTRPWGRRVVSGPKTNVALRLPDDLHESIRQMADQENRSLNGQIVHILAEAAQPTDVPSATSITGTVAHAYIPFDDEPQNETIEIHDPDVHVVAVDGHHLDDAIEAARDHVLRRLGYVRTGPWESTDGQSFDAPVRHVNATQPTVRNHAKKY